MEPLTMLIIYGMSFIAGLVTLTFMAQFSFMKSIFFRSFAGGSAGGLTSWYMVSFSPILSFTEYSVNGKFGLGGYLFLISIITLLIVWGWNLFNHRGQVIR